MKQRAKEARLAARQALFEEQVGHGRDGFLKPVIHAARAGSTEHSRRRPGSIKNR